MSSNILLFPYSTIEALKFEHQYGQLFSKVYKASSVDISNSIIRLPYATSEQFEDEFLQLVDRLQLDAVCTSSIVVQSTIKNIVSKRDLDLQVVSTTSTDICPQVEQVVSKSYDVYTYFSSLLGSRRQKSLREFDAIVQLSLIFKGESSPTKLAMLLAIIDNCNIGDIVEIGALAGRSAAVLLYGSRSNKVGKVLCVDPWSAVDAQQRDSSPALQQAADQGLMDSIFSSFLRNIIPLNCNDINYIRAASHTAIQQYEKAEPVSSVELGETTYNNSVTLLHVDGNHDFQSVMQDLQDWSPHLSRGAWIVLDDYIWSLGNGVKKAADCFTHSRSEDIRRAFVYDQSLYIQFL